MELHHCDSSDKNFQELVSLLDEELAIRDGKDHGIYHQFNGIAGIKNAIVLFQNGRAIGCGAFKPFDGTSVEIKRMYVLPEARGSGAAGKILAGLESRAKNLGFKKAVLETGLKQPEAIGLYQKSGYIRIENYGQYAGIENSVCFSKNL